MTDIQHDYEFPFIARGVHSQRIWAKFTNRGNAEQYVRLVSSHLALNYEVIDTTPKPKIPADAEYIMYLSNRFQTPRYAKRVGHPANKVWELSYPISQLSEEALLELIGEQDVIVLEPRS